MLSHKELTEKALANPEVAKEYARLEPEYALLDELLRARKAAGLTQKEVAERMGTKAPAVSRLMSSLGADKHSPSIATLRKYARACGMDLKIELVEQRPCPPAVDGSDIDDGPMWRKGEQLPRKK